MSRVQPDDVRDVIKVTTTQLPNPQLYKMIKRAATILGAEVGEYIDYTNCSDEEKEGITLIAALAAIAYLTGGTFASGSSMSSVSRYTLGQVTVESTNTTSSRASESSPLGAQRAELTEELNRLLTSLKRTGFRVVSV